MNCCQCQGIEACFNRRMAEADLKRYRRVSAQPVWGRLDFALTPPPPADGGFPPPLSRRRERGGSGEQSEPGEG